MPRRIVDARKPCRVFIYRRLQQVIEWLIAIGLRTQAIAHPAITQLA
jgi:hypothetical protein